MQIPTDWIAALFLPRIWTATGADAGLETAMSNIPLDQFARLIRARGTPPRLEHGPDEDAVFDPFEFEGQEFFQYYDSRTVVWGLGRTLGTAQRRTPQVINSAPLDSETLAAVEALSFLPPPRVPGELTEFSGMTEALFRGPFWYKERQFGWHFEDHKEGWTLMILTHGPEAEHTIGNQ